MAKTAKTVDSAELLSKYRDHVAELVRRYARVLDEQQLAGVVIHSGAPKARSLFDDQFWPLRPVPHFAHWLPLQTSRSALLIESGKKPTLFWANVLDFWEAAAKPETDHFWASFDVREVGDASTIGSLLPKGRKLAFIGEEKGDCAAWGLPESAFNPKALLSALDQVRVLKTPYELLCLAEANRRAALGHRAVVEAFTSGETSELELHLLYLRATQQDDAETPYKNIVALGDHCATLHHVNYDRKKSAAQSLLLDAGAKYQGYDSDVTRTAVKGGGAAASAFAALAVGLEKLQQESCRRAQLGLQYEALHDGAHQLLAPLLKDVGVANGSAEELVAKGVTRKFLPHGLGHALGLQTHDVGCRNVEPRADNPFLRNTTKIAPGQVFTIEPGIYFIRHLMDELKASPAGSLVNWPLVQQLMPFGGIRIEDDVAVTERGVVNLTREVLPDPPLVIAAG